MHVATTATRKLGMIAPRDGRANRVQRSRARINGRGGRSGPGGRRLRGTVLFGLKCRNFLEAAMNMKRLACMTLSFSLATAAAAVVSADVKTQEKTLVKFEGGLGRLLGLFGGKAAREGVVSTVAVKGDRKMSMSEFGGQIVDLAEEKIYDLNVRDKSYTVMTFAEYRKRLEEAQARAKQEASGAQQEQAAPTEAKEVEVEFTVKQTGQKKTVAGYETREVILTVTVREKGKPLEEGGGLVVTSDLWLADRIPALAEIQDFDRRYAERLLGPLGVGVDAQQLAMATAFYPMIKDAMARMQQESNKLEGVPLATTVTFEGVKSKAQMAEGSSQQQETGGGVGGMLARRLMRKKPEGQAARTTILTSTHEVLSIQTSAADADVAVPAGFREKKSK